MSRLRELLIRHEGVRLKAYRDSEGVTTIGCGRNLDDVGISELEAMAMLAADLERVNREAGALPWLQSLSAVRCDVVLDMLFNLGLRRLLGFHKMIEALRLQNYDRAADEMLASKWAAQVGLRAKELAQMMRFNRYLSEAEIRLL